MEMAKIQSVPIDEDALKQLVGHNLKTLRQKVRLSRIELAELLGLSRHTVNALELGKIFPKIPTMIMLAACFDVSIDEILGYNPLISQEIKKSRLRLENAIECLSQFGKVERADDSDSYVLSIVALESYKDKLREVQGEIVFPTKENLIRFSESISEQALSSNQTLKEIFLEQLNFLLNDQLLNNDSAETSA